MFITCEKKSRYFWGYASTTVTSKSSLMMKNLALGARGGLLNAPLWGRYSIFFRSAIRGNLGRLNALS